MDLLTALVLLNVALLQFEGVWSQQIDLYHRTGEETTMSCDKHHGPKCSDVEWNHWRVDDPSLLVQNGQIKPSPRSSRLTLNPDCSLTVHNITEEDFGLYRCGGSTTSWIVIGNIIYLSVLSVSSSPSNQSGLITLQCSLWRYYELSCPQNCLRWLDTDGTVLSGDGVTQDKCVSNLTVERESQHQRTFTCQFVEDGEVKVEFRLKGNSEDTDRTKGNCEESQRFKGWSWFLVLKTVGWSALISATVVVSIYARVKGKPKRSNGDFEMIVCSPDVNPGNMAPPADYENQP